MLEHAVRSIVQALQAFLYFFSEQDAAQGRPQSSQPDAKTPCTPRDHGRLERAERAEEERAERERAQLAAAAFFLQ